MKIFLFLCFMMLQSVLCWAHAPSAVDLSYDVSSQSLQITVKHVTKDMRKHYIRMIVIFKNDEEVDRIYSPKQSSVSEHLAQVSLAAAVGDVIKVKAYCSEAGIKEQVLVIEDKEEAEEDQDIGE